MIPAEEQKTLPEDENNPEKRTNKLWAYFKKGEHGNRPLLHPKPCFLLSPDPQGGTSVTHPETGQGVAVLTHA